MGVALSVAAVSVMGTATAAEAHTGSEIIRAACGSGYSIVSDGTRSLRTDTGKTWGYVYLTYNRSSGVNCVVTHKTAYHGTPTETYAEIAVGTISSARYYNDLGRYSHYAVVKASARGRCVAYEGYIGNSSDTNWAHGGRYTFGNCG